VIQVSKDNPAILWEESKLGKKFFGLLKPDASGAEHRLERAYVWQNAGEWEQTRDEEQCLLFQVPDKASTSRPEKNVVKFCRVANKIRVKKMLAQLQTGSAMSSDFDISRKNVEWRIPTVAEERKQTELLREMLYDVNNNNNANGGADNATMGNGNGVAPH